MSSSMGMLALATAATPWGIEACRVQVEVDVRLGMPQMHLVGLPDTAVRESKERVASAIRNCGFELPPRRVLINLAPANLRKEGSHLDLAIALALLSAHEKLPADSLENLLVCGELGLDGTLRPVRGGLAIASLARELGLRELLVPTQSANEAAALPGVDVIAVASLTETIEHIAGLCTLPPVRPRPRAQQRGGPDLADVRGQPAAKRVLEIAAAGNHNVLFIGPPGCGKTMLSRCLPGLLPPLANDEAITVTKIQSIGGAAPPDGLVRTRPFRSPHTDTTTAGMIGGTASARPGEVTLAHAGALFLDELPEFRRETLEALRQPLEDGEVTVVRAAARFTYPARFLLIAAMNPCPCGHLGNPRRECRCPPGSIERYRARISGPLLDRIDLQAEVPAPSLEELAHPPGETSFAVAARVEAAREVQAERFADTAWTLLNGAMDTQRIDRHCRLGDEARTLLHRAYERLGLSARTLHRVQRVARTIADLDQAEDIAAGHLAEALQYRSLDRSSML